MWGATPVSRSVAEAVTRRTGVGWVPAYGSHRTAGHRLQSARRGPARLGRTPGARREPCGWCRWRPARRSPPARPGEIQARAESLMAGYLPAEATRRRLL